MLIIPSSELTKNFQRYQEIAQHEPIAVTSNDRVIGYFISNIEYAQYVSFKENTSKAYATEELLEATIQAIATSKMDAKHLHLNNLLD